MVKNGSWCVHVTQQESNFIFENYFQYFFSDTLSTVNKKKLKY